jgi:phospholipid-binding lipoprotein MlaA
MKNMRRARSGLKWAIACVLPVLLGACAGVPRDASLPVSDPNENMNRRVMAMNQETMRPASEVVKATIPGPVHDRVRDLNANMKEPRIFVNNLLQGRFEAAGQTGHRFFLNTVFGWGGLFDIASGHGIPQQSGDFGQTLFVWGVPEGPYVVRPYLGPATTRDAVGQTVDMFNPFAWWLAPPVAITVGAAGLDAVDQLGQLKQAEDASIDFYSFVRSSYYQMRRAELREALGQQGDVDSPALAELDDPAVPAVPAAPARNQSASAAKRSAAASTKATP